MAFRTVVFEEFTLEYVLSFPAGWSGIGLLLLRLTTAIALVWIPTGATAFGDGAWAIFGCIVSLAVAIALATGSASAVAAIAALGLVGAITVGAAPAWPGPAAWLLAGNAVTIACAGPGAYSIDGWRKGRREIVIPGGQS